ncbi:MAG: hypothetical protein EZS28_045892, partial [Streblomastix strix]
MDRLKQLEIIQEEQEQQKLEEEVKRQYQIEEEIDELKYKDTIDDNEDMMDEELEYDEQEYIKKYKLIQQKKMENSLISYIHKIKDKADDILAPIVQQFLYDPDAVIQKVMGDYTFEYIMLFQKYGWRFLDDDEDDEEEDEDLFENNKEQNNKKKKKKKKKRQYQIEEEIDELKYKDTIDDNEEQQMNDLKDDLDRIKKEQDLIEKQRLDDEMKIKLIEEKLKQEKEQEELKQRLIIQMNLDNSDKDRNGMEKEDKNMISIQEIQRWNELMKSFLEEEEKGNNNGMNKEDVNVLLLTY